MTGKIAQALASAATNKVAAAIQDASNAAAVVGPAEAKQLAQAAVSDAVDAPQVRGAIEAALPKPIAWQKSQAIWGAIVSGLGGLILVAPDVLAALAPAFPAYGDVILKAAGAVTTAIGVYNAIQGRVTTSRPIAGTAAAERVQSAAQ